MDWDASPQINVSLSTVQHRTVAVQHMYDPCWAHNASFACSASFRPVSPAPSFCLSRDFAVQCSPTPELPPSPYQDFWDDPSHSTTDESEAEYDPDVPAPTDTSVRPTRTLRFRGPIPERPTYNDLHDRLNRYIFEHDTATVSLMDGQASITYVPDMKAWRLPESEFYSPFVFLRRKDTQPDTIVTFHANGTVTQHSDTVRHTTVGQSFGRWYADNPGPSRNHVAVQAGTGDLNEDGLRPALLEILCADTDTASHDSSSDDEPTSGPLQMQRLPSMLSGPPWFSPNRKKIRAMRRERAAQRRAQVLDQSRASTQQPATLEQAELPILTITDVDML